MIGNYTFTIREHETKPNLVYANLKNGDVLFEWTELDAAALPLAWEHAQRYVYPNSKAPQSKRSEMMLWGMAIAVLVLSVVTSYVVLNRVNNCAPQQRSTVQG
jgi:hypothetical protein